MPTYTFGYTPIQIPPSDPFPQGQTAHRPLLKAQIVAPDGKHFFCLVCLDTGADHCIFPLSFAGPLGLDPLKMKMTMTGGVGSVANATYYENISIHLHVLDMPTLSFTTMAGFTAGMDAQGIGLLGQCGFFETFPVTFNHGGKEFSIHAP